MKKMLEMSVCNAPFRFQNRIFKQIDGVAMGSSLVLILSYLWMQKMERKLNRFSTNKPIIWIRYVDDVYCLFDIPRTKIIEFHSRINRWHKNLNFTIVFELNDSLAFLDVLVTRKNLRYTEKCSDAFSTGISLNI